MSELTELGYPEGYHMGFSAILWWITISVIAILGAILYLNARKSDLINTREMFLSKSLVFVCYVINFSLFQVGVLHPEQFILFYLIGNSIVLLSLTLYFYFWEKNLTALKHIPTLSVGTASVIVLISLIIYFLFPDTVMFSTNVIDIFASLLVYLAYIFYIFLISRFSKYVRGVSSKVAIIWIGGVLLGLTYIAIDYPPGARIVPSYIVFYIAPILFITAQIMVVYGVITLFPEMSSYYAQTQKCAVHRGVIEKGTTVYYCPSCGITYCESCYNQVIIKDGCWNCRHGVEVEIEKEWKAEQVIDVKKGAKSKHKSPNK